MVVMSPLRGKDTEKNETLWICKFDDIGSQSRGFLPFLPQPDLGCLCLNEDILTHPRSTGGPRASHKPAVPTRVARLLCVQLHYHRPDL